MQDLRVYKVGEEVLIKTRVTGVTITENGAEYNLMNPQEGRPFPWRFYADQVFSVDSKGATDEVS